MDMKYTTTTTSDSVQVLGMKQRLNYIDIAKGILILMVIYNHTENLASASGVHNWVIDIIPNTGFFRPFFMPAFFVIAGCCSNYEKGFKDFIISNAKALLIPAVLLLFVRIFVRFLFTGTFSMLEWHAIVSKNMIVQLGHWNWFLTALFLTKVIYYLLLHWTETFKSRFIIACVIHVVGVVFFNYKGEGIFFYNFYFYQHALMFLLFVEIGYDLAKNNIKSFGLTTNAGIFFVFYFGYLFIGRKLPAITSDPYVPVMDIIPHLIMAVCGSFMIIELSEKIRKNVFLEEFGRHSLVIYCLHFQFMFSFYQIFKEQLNLMGVHHTLTSLIILYFFTAYGCLWFSKLLNTKYLKWIIGKF